MKTYKVGLLIAIIICSSVIRIHAQDKSVKELNVKDFGAKGNGVSDDYKSIQNCINEALKFQSSKVVFPPGRYKISQGLIAHYLYNNMEIIGIMKSSASPVIFCNNQVSVLSIRGYLEPKSVGSITIRNINLQGGFKSEPYNPSNKFINKPTWFYGISITDKQTATIENVNVSDIYGQGIFISTTQQMDIPLGARFDKISILNCRIANCWGFNPKSDDYGDGIYISDVASGVIDNNIIVNNFSTTKQFGRCGIVLEFMSQNCVVSNNTIFGYDRGIHLEADYGNHIIKNNKISGSDLGIVLYNTSINGGNNPVQIIGNNISNYGLPKVNKLLRTRDITAISDRSLLNFVAEGKCRAGSLISNNTFKIFGTYDYFSTAIVNIKADDLLIRNNNYIVQNPGLLKQPIMFYNYSNSIPKNDEFNGVRMLQFKKSKVGNNTNIIKDNRLNTTKLEIN